MAGGEAAFHGALLGLCSAVLLMAALMSVRGGREVLLPGFAAPLPELCTSKRLWGLDCPGCGLTRAFISLADGDVARAWSYNPAAIWLFAIVAFQVPWRVVQVVRLYVGRRELSLGYATHVSLVVLAVGMVAQWIAKVAG